MKEGNFESQAPRRDASISGRKLEASLVGHNISSGWDAEGYIGARQQQSPQAQTMVMKWVTEHVMPSRDWSRLNPEQKKEALFDWVEQHQPEGWDPKDPPLNEETIEGITSPTFLQDLHYAVAEGLAKELLLQDKIAQGLPRTISEDELEDYLENSAIMEMLEVYTSADTPLDTLYGTDLFFKCGFSAEGSFMNARLPVDVTTDEKMKIEKGFATKIHGDYLLKFDLYNQNGEPQKITAEQIKEKGRDMGHYLFRRMEELITRQQKMSA